MLDHGPNDESKPSSGHRNRYDREAGVADPPRRREI